MVILKLHFAYIELVNSKNIKRKPIRAHKTRTKVYIDTPIEFELKTLLEVRMHKVSVPLKQIIVTNPSIHLCPTPAVNTQIWNQNYYVRAT